MALPFLGRAPAKRGDWPNRIALDRMREELGNVCGREVDRPAVVYDGSICGPVCLWDPAREGLVIFRGARLGPAQCVVRLGRRDRLSWARLDPADGSSGFLKYEILSESLVNLD